MTFTGAAPATIASSPGVSRSFCGRCGSPVAFAGDRYPGEIHLHLGLLDVPDLLPTRHGSHDEKLPWLKLEPPSRA